MTREELKAKGWRQRYRGVDGKEVIGWAVELDTALKLMEENETLENLITAHDSTLGGLWDDYTALREQLRWRDVEKEKPDMEDCIVWVAGGEDLGPRKDIAFYNSQSKRWGSFRLHDWAGGTITHWMPLPQPPEEK